MTRARANWCVFVVVVIVFLLRGRKRRCVHVEHKQILYPCVVWNPTYLLTFYLFCLLASSCFRPERSSRVFQTRYSPCILVSFISQTTFFILHVYATFTARRTICSFSFFIALSPHHLHDINAAFEWRTTVSVWVFVCVDPISSTWACTHLCNECNGGGSS